MGRNSYTALILCIFLAGNTWAKPQAQSPPSGSPPPSASANPPPTNGTSHQPPGNVTIIKSESSIPGDGNFKYDFELSDGTKSEQTGRLINVGKPNEGVVIQGSYSFVGTDGKTYSVSYVADENGFQPKGDHIPIVKSALANSTDTSDDGVGSNSTDSSSSSSGDSGASMVTTLSPNNLTNSNSTYQ